MKKSGVAGMKLGVDFVDINMIQIFKDAKIDWVDGMTPMMEARAVKNVDEQECFRIVGAIGDATHWECMKFLRPGITENQVTAHMMQYLYNIPGMEDVEDVIVSSGLNTWPNWRNFSDRIIKPGDIVFMDLAALTWNGYKSCYYRTYCVGKEPTKEQKETYAIALKWLYDSIGAVKVGATTRDIALKWPSAKETWGYEDEDQAAANLWGHGLGLAQYDPPVISRIWSLDHPGRDQGRHGVRARDAARQDAPVGRAHRGDADRAQGQDRDHLQFPGRADHRRRSDARLFELWEKLVLPLLGRGPGELIVPLASPEAADADRFGPKAANLARLGHAGLPIPAGFCVDAEAYRIQVAHWGWRTPRATSALSPGRSRATARRAAPLAMKLGLMDQPIVPEVLEPLLEARRALVEATGALMVVRSSALVEDRFGSSFAGQFESYLGLEGEAEFITAVRSCWAALWSTRVLRYMATHDASPADTAMAILVQPLVAARVAGGGLSRTADGDMVLNATWGLGSAIAQGEVVPERIVLTRDGAVRGSEAGRMFHRAGCAHGDARRAARALFPSRA